MKNKSMVHLPLTEVPNKPRNERKATMEDLAAAIERTPPIFPVTMLRGENGLEIISGQARFEAAMKMNMAARVVIAGSDEVFLAAKNPLTDLIDLTPEAPKKRIARP